MFISLPGDILNAEAGIELGRSTRIDTRVRPSEDSLTALAARILKAERPVIVVGDEIVKSDALREAADLAEALGCPAWQSPTPYGAHFLSESPSFMGAIARLQKVARDVLAPHDLLIALGGDPLRMSVYSEVDPLPDGLSIVQVGLVDGDLARNYGAEIAVKADVKETLRALVPALKQAGGGALESARQTGGSRRCRPRTGRRNARRWSSRSRRPARPRRSIRTGSRCKSWKRCPDNAILVDEGLTSSRQIIGFEAASRPLRLSRALASGGIGWGLPASVGVSLANPQRPVVCYSGDSSSMYSIQSLWTAANHKLPLNFVIVNNGGYRIIKQRLLAFHGDDNYVGMDFIDPPVDFTGARAFARARGDQDHGSAGAEGHAEVCVRPPGRRS